MNLLEITMVILGIIIIIISCRIIDRPRNGKEIPSGGEHLKNARFTEEEINQIKNKQMELLSGISEEAIVRTDDYLSKLSNEKIMAVSEFSDQILEKIKRNHEEVVFLYNMLNDKEKELKTAVREIDGSKKKVKDLMDSKKEQSAKEQPVKKTAQIQKQIAVSASADREKSKEAPVPDPAGSNHNSQILNLYSQGKSIIEISKLLGLGQGEVKLVIDLFKGKK